MKNIKMLFVLISLLIIPVMASASSYLLFQNDTILDLSLVEADGGSATYVLQNKSGTRVSGSMGDLIGFQEAEVVVVDDSYIAVEHIEIVSDQDGNEYEQPSRMKIPLAGGSHGKGGRVWRMVRD